MPLTRRVASRLSATPRANIARIQRGQIFIEVANSAQQFILPFAVDVDKTRLRLLGSISFPSSNVSWQSHFVMIRLTAPTAVRADIFRAVGANQSSVSVSFELTEYA